MFRTTSDSKLLLSMHVTTIRQRHTVVDICVVPDMIYSLLVLYSGKSPPPPPPPPTPFPPRSIFQPPNRSAVTDIYSRYYISISNLRQHKNPTITAWAGKLSGHIFCTRPNRNLLRGLKIQ